MSVNLSQKYEDGIAAFVMPMLLDGGAQSIQWLNDAIDSLLAQTDPNWQLVMVDDRSPLPNAAAVLRNIQARDERIHLIRSKTSEGPGTARNIGIQWAHKNNFPIVLFLDADDMSHPKRVEIVRDVLVSDPSVGVVYSTFTVIEETNREVPYAQLSEPIREILEGHREDPPQDTDAWIDIGTLTGYANLTSSTAVATDVAIKHPFPKARAAEDAHTWFRYGAEGRKFVYRPDIPSFYRIPQYAGDSASRDRLGGADVFYSQQCELLREGFEQAITIAIANGTLHKSEHERLLARYHVRMAETMRRANQPELAEGEIKKAYAISPRFASEWIDFHNYIWAIQKTREPQLTLA